MDSSMKLMIMIALVCFPVSNSLILPTNASRSLLLQHSTNDPDLVHPLNIIDEALCEIACHNAICEHLHGTKKSLCLVGCIVGCAIIPDKNSATNPAFRRLHSCAVQNCAFVGKEEIDIDIGICTSRVKEWCGV